MGIPTFRRQCMPYHLVEIKKGYWLIQNREYQSIGMPCKLNLTKARLCRLAATGIHACKKNVFWSEQVNEREYEIKKALTVREFWLYDDHNHPDIDKECMKEYINKLCLLLGVTKRVI